MGSGAGAGVGGGGAGGGGAGGADVGAVVGVVVGAVDGGRDVGGFVVGAVPVGSPAAVAVPVSSALVPSAGAIRQIAVRIPANASAGVRVDPRTCNAHSHTGTGSANTHTAICTTRRCRRKWVQPAGRSLAADAIAVPVEIAAVAGLIAVHRCRPGCSSFGAVPERRACAAGCDGRRCRGRWRWGRGQRRGGRWWGWWGRRWRRRRDRRGGQRSRGGRRCCRRCRRGTGRRRRRRGGGRGRPVRYGLGVTGPAEQRTDHHHQHETCSRHAEPRPRRGPRRRRLVRVSARRSWRSWRSAPARGDVGRWHLGRVGHRSASRGIAESVPTLRVLVQRGSGATPAAPGAQRGAVRVRRGRGGGAPRSRVRAPRPGSTGGARHAPAARPGRCGRTGPRGGPGSPSTTW